MLTTTPDVEHRGLSESGQPLAQSPMLSAVDPFPHPEEEARKRDGATSPPRRSVTTLASAFKSEKLERAEYSCAMDTQVDVTVFNLAIGAGSVMIIIRGRPFAGGSHALSMLQLRHLTTQHKRDRMYDESGQFSPHTLPRLHRILQLPTARSSR
ncbi:hypothetical protein WOLCODRAFT_152712 [Wolfiporia cocos MD-104 SS10]|uniref:Uncharacterized protein n=1 Tax=Wolfiporia cocos (strain MD-104) TaxID=742152 RepID=A0A2H3K0Y4_WOLCO|nr:hypothetical protein WOLCODRAFT_152712 [Wolfiporia cocos MD-104 SS10]